MRMRAAPVHSIVPRRRGMPSQGRGNVENGLQFLWPESAVPSAVARSMPRPSSFRRGVLRFSIPTNRRSENVPRKRAKCRLIDRLKNRRPTHSVTAAKLRQTRRTFADFGRCDEPMRNRLCERCGSGRVSIEFIDFLERSS